MKSNHTILRRSGGAAVMAVAALLTLTACIEWRRQTLTFRHDAAADTLLIHQDYQGLYGADQRERLSDQEIEQINSVFTGQRTFFFANWILEFNRAAVEQSLEAMQREAAPDPKQQGARYALTRLARLLLDNVTITNGVLSLNADGELCGTQRVRLRNVATVIRAANTAIQAVLRAEAEDPGREADVARIYRAAAAGPPDFITLKGNVLSVRVPMAAAAYKESLEDSADGWAMAEAFRREGVTIRHADDALHVQVGREGDSITRVSVPVHEKPWTPNLLNHLSATHKILKSHDAGQEAAQFLGGAK